MLGKDNSGRITISFRYNPDLVTKVKSVPRHKWHPAEKYWSFQNTNGTFEKILEVFKGEEIHLDPALQGTVPDLRTKRSGVVESGLSPTLENLRRELLSRKYSAIKPSKDIFITIGTF